MSQAALIRLEANATHVRKGAGGPRSEAGKARSSLNALRHGLGAVQVLLPGEDGQAYERLAQGVFEALAPSNEAEGQLVALVVDDMWRLERLSKVEQALGLARVEELTAQVDDQASVTAGVIHQVGSALEAWMAPPMPLERCEELSRRVQVVRKATTVVMDLLPAFPLDRVAAVEKELLRVDDRVANLFPPSSAFQAVQGALRQLLIELLAKGEAEQGRQDQTRQAVATLALPAEQELRKLFRYRKGLEEGLQRRLDALEAFRRLSTASEAPGSQSLATEYRLRLRVVR